MTHQVEQAQRMAADLYEALAATYHATWAAQLR